ncbi:DUF5060 domain-containing protein [Pedobacter sp. HMF7647]|uniref:DUF5060 domain-containing protein n=1 Tax=Hufsiella arboris TaxID=2695275 RepID=A0A7K1Y7K9_9SPHI|nr:DUF5060 domain-containing protein [Hufsiella arboris]MXV50564.1 DUF5060 domain-containing protein [Hufsiella arboris]
MKKSIIITSLLLCLQVNLFAQIQKVTLLNLKPSTFKKAEFDIKLIAEWVNPYLQEDVSLDMLITSPSGKKLLLPCYYENGKSGKMSLWKARFAPQESGTYRYTIKLFKSGKNVSTTKPAAFTAFQNNGKGFLHVKNNWIMQFDNGAPFRGIGENICWESRANDDSRFYKELHENPKYNYEYMLRSLADHGGNFYRTWICSWNLPLDWKSGINNNRYTNSDEYFNPSAIQRLERVMKLSDSLGVYTMLTLGPGAYLEKDGGNVKSAADFFVKPEAKARYKNRLRYIIARWGYNTCIANWELFNEIDNVQFGDKDNPIDASVIVKWHDEMSTYIKSIDPYKHPVTTSISHRDLAGLNSLSNIDINQKHIYKNTDIIPETIVKYETEFKKPYVIGEYGFEWDWSKNFDDFASDMDRDFKKGLWYGLFSPTPVLPMTWWWEYFDNRKTDVYIKKVRTIYDQMISAGEGNFKTVKVQTSNPGVRVMAVECGKKIFIYVLNNSSEKQDVIIFIPRPTTSPKVFDCEKGTYQTVQSTDKNIALKAIGQNAEIIIVAD